MEDRNECDKPCGMNYCDENGCTNRKRDLVDLVYLIKDNKELKPHNMKKVSITLTLNEVQELYQLVRESAEFMHSLAQQSVNSELIEALKQIKDSSDKHSYINDIASKSLLSASRNQQSEKSAPSQVVEEAMKVTQKDVRVPNSIRNGEVLLPQQNEKESDADLLVEFLDSIRDYERENKQLIAYDERESIEFVEIFLQSKTNPPKEK